MKKNILLMASILLASTHAFANTENGWWRDDFKYYKAWANSEDSRVQAVIQRRAMNSDSPYVEFRLITLNKEYCQGKGESFTGEQTINVNDEPIVFNIRCFNQEYANMVPANPKGRKYILDDFGSSRNKVVKFVIPASEKNPYSMFEFPTKYFDGFYRSMEKSLKKPI